MAEPPHNIVIVGGSLSGLMHGIVAAQQGNNVTILERSPSKLEAQLGAGLGVAEALATFMSRHDRTQQPYSICPPQALYVDSQGKEINITRPGISATSWSTLYSRLRANFEGLASESLQEPVCGRHPDAFGLGFARYVNGAEVVAIQEGDGVIQVEFLERSHQKLVTLSADLVIAADGAGSKTRALFAPHVSCRYVGYAAWRGTIREKDMVEEKGSPCQRNDRHCKIDRSFFLSYTIPGEDGSLDRDKRLRNWVWYKNYARNGAELSDILVDRHGCQHQYALPPDTIREDVWERQQRLAIELLDSESASLVTRTKRPFFQTITEAVAERAVFCDGKLLLVGDALAVLRPLSGQGTSQAAHSALLLEEVFAGRIGIEEWEESVLRHSRKANELGLEREEILDLGERKETV